MKGQATSFLLAGHLTLIVLLLSSLMPTLATAPAEAAVASLTFRNPVKDDGADPWMFYSNGYYYLTYTRGDRIKISKSATLTGLGSAPEITVWGPVCCNLWAPEVHYLNGRWYIYYAADDGNNENHRMYVLESTSSDPQGSYVSKGKIAATSDRWAIDGTVLRKSDGSLYFIWSGWPGTINGQQNLYIAPMSNPWTISGERVLISEPTYDWEQVGMPINEGPAILQRNGKIFLVYSASGCWTDDYKLGMLTNSDGNVLNASSWQKSPTPVFQRSDENRVFGPGHNSFIRSPDGTEDWIVYHANGNAGDGCGPLRSTRVQKFSWNADGTPNFGEPVNTYTPLPIPSGDSGSTGPAVANGTYRIIGRGSGKALDVSGCSTADGADVIIWPYWGGNCQRWYLEYLDDGSYRITPMVSGKALDVNGCSTADSADVIVWSYWGGDCQRWYIDERVDGKGDRYYRILAKNSGKSLDVSRCSTADGADVIVWPYWTGDCQQWYLEPVPVLADGTYRITPRNNQDNALDVGACSTADGADVIVWSYWGGDCQQWQLQHLNDNFFKITAKNSGKALDVGGCSTADGADVIIWPYWGGDCQKWHLEYLNDGLFKITAKNSGKALHIANCSSTKGADVIIWTYSGRDCQQWLVGNP